MSSVSATSNSHSTGSSAAGATGATGSSALSSEDFYTLLTAEIKNQDPTEPVNNTDLVLQLTQLSAAQSTLELNDNMATYITSGALSTATSMIGTTVTYTDSKSNTCTGVVASVEKDDSTYNLVLSDGTSVALDDVRTVKATPATTTTNTNSSSSSSSSN